MRRAINSMEIPNLHLSYYSSTSDFSSFFGNVVAYEAARCFAIFSCLLCMYSVLRSSKASLSYSSISSYSTTRDLLQLFLNTKHKITITINTISVMIMACSKNSSNFLDLY